MEKAAPPAPPRDVMTIPNTPQGIDPDELAVVHACRAWPFEEARRLIEFLGLPWNDKCVDFHKSDRPVKTASVAQVRKPIYKTSVKRWKKYGGGLQPLIDAIDGKAEKPAAKGKAKVKENA